MGKEGVDQEKPLTNRERLFVEHYLAGWNASAAARNAGYSDKSAAVEGHRLLRKANVLRAIQIRVTEAAMSANEVLARLAEQARFNANDFLNEKGTVDLVEAKRLGLGKYIRRIKTQSGEHSAVDLEFVDTQGALALLGKHFKLFTDKTELIGSVSVKNDLSAMTNEQLEARLRLLEKLE